MFCFQCGTSVSDSAKFCNACGTRLNSGEVIEQKNNVVPLHPVPESVQALSATHEPVVMAHVAVKTSMPAKVNALAGGRQENAICLHCGFKGDMSVETVIAPGHESWKFFLIGGILFSILFIALMSEGLSPVAFLLPLIFFLVCAYSYSQKLDCFHCSSCHEISYKSGNGTWSTEKDTRKWYLKSWTDSSLPIHQKIILFVVFAAIFGFFRIYLNGHN